MLERLKHAAMVLAGRRPAESEYDTIDRRLARELSREWAETYFNRPFSAGSHGSRAEVEEVIFNAICEYICAVSEHRHEESARRRKTLQVQMEIPF